MLSFKRLMYIVLVVAVLGGIFLIYNINESRPASVQVQGSLAAKREFMEVGQVDEGEKTRVWILGDRGSGLYGDIYGNVRKLCEDLHLTVAGEGYLDADRLKERDLVIFCDAFVSPYGDPQELEEFIAGGGRVILAAGFAEENSPMQQVFGICKSSAKEDCHDLVFEKPLLPVQPDRVCYDGNSGSFRIEVNDDASVYLRSGENDVPILYTYAWQKGGICLINGTFLADVRCMGLLTGAMGALLPDFVYPVLGVKTIFLDNFPQVTPAADELCRQVYGYSMEGFVQDVVWPALRGISLRTDTPYTLRVVTEVPSEGSFEAVDDALLTAMARSVLQFGGELAYDAGCPENGYAIFPAATQGNSMEDGNLFAICSVLGAYGMVSHVFHTDALIAGDDNAAWDFYKRQIGIFEAEILARAPWLEGRTLSQAGDDVRSYEELDYGWIKSGSRMELYCSGAVKGQAFFYHTDDRIAGAEGLTYENAGNGYYLLRIQDSRGIIALEEGK